MSMRTRRSRELGIKQHVDEMLAGSVPDNALLAQLSKQCTDNPSQDNSFQYAFALCKSTDEGELAHAVAILDSLVANGYEHQADCLYGSAVAYYLLGDFARSRAIAEMILRSRGGRHDLASQLHTASIVSKEQRDRKQAAAALGGTVAVAAIGVACLLGGRKR
mmetsp:Transcript_12476/g.28538  ORF Transcript_12476/g.28538 Transcript_12476/m.28538 type:complete len:163 (+) Transcript_12476:271-759(+)